MTSLTRSALWRGLFELARVFCTKQARGVGPMPPLDPRLARDIGLTESEQELLRHRWPSETMRHPRL